MKLKDRTMMFLIFLKNLPYEVGERRSTVGYQRNATDCSEKHAHLADQVGRKIKS